MTAAAAPAPRDEVPLRDAATIVVVRRDGEHARVLMGMRGAKAAFMPSKYVFPGGAVDPEDAHTPLARPLEPRHRSRLVADGASDGPAPDTLAAAALRELAEETGLIVGQPGACDWPGYATRGLRPDAAGLIYAFRAITPAGRPRRFDARFFLLDAATLSCDPDDFSDACDELSHLHWVALEAAQALDLPFITEVVLAELAQLLQGLPADAPLPSPATVPFFDNRTSQPRFRQIP